MALTVFRDTQKEQGSCGTGALNRECLVAPSSVFSIDVLTDPAPTFQGYQIVIQYSGNINLVQQPALTENEWPRCGPGFETKTLPSAGAPGRYVLGCKSGPPATNYSGVLANIHFSCKGSGSGLIGIIGGAGAHVSFYDRPSIFGNRIFLASEAKGGIRYADAVVINCGGQTGGLAGDTDGDGCANTKEQGTNERTGGRRDYLNPWDFFDPNGDGLHRNDDIVAVMQRYMTNEGGANYSAAYDRTLLGPNYWNLGPPNGQIRLDDIMIIRSLYYHDCL
jgi:hypothetical protein